MTIVIFAFALVAVGVFFVLYKAFDMEFGSAFLSALLGAGLLGLLTSGAVYLGALF